MSKPLFLVVSCGGTGGHSFPGLAVASELSARGHRVLVVRSGRPEESARGSSDLPPGVESVCVSSLPLSARRPRSVAVLAAGVARLFFLFLRHRPDALLAMGSYTSFAPVLAARALRVPVVLHEANAIPGKAVRALARFARTVCTAFPGVESFFPAGVRTVRTGVPSRRDFAPGAASSETKAGCFTVLVTGGSQGARDLNDKVVAAWAWLREKEPALFATMRAVHVAGAANEADVRECYVRAGLPADRFEVLGFTNEMERLHREADFCIGRAGASTCFEAAQTGLPILFVPLPKLANEHQKANAKAFADVGAGAWMEQEACTPEALGSRIAEVARDEAGRRAMREALRRLAQPGGTARTADAVEGVAQGRVAGS